MFLFLFKTYPLMLSPQLSYFSSNSDQTLALLPVVILIKYLIALFINSCGIFIAIFFDINLCSPASFVPAQALLIEREREREKLS